MTWSWPGHCLLLSYCLSVHSAWRISPRWKHVHRKICDIWPISMRALFDTLSVRFAVSVPDDNGPRGRIVKSLPFLIFCALLVAVAAAGVALQSMEASGNAAQFVPHLLILQ